jgi:hypothetical protein
MRYCPNTSIYHVNEDAMTESAPRKIPTNWQRIIRCGFISAFVATLLGVAGVLLSSYAPVLLFIVLGFLAPIGILALIHPAGGWWFFPLAFLFWFLCGAIIAYKIPKNSHAVIFWILLYFPLEVIGLISMPAVAY